MKYVYDEECELKGGEPMASDAFYSEGVRIFVDLRTTGPHALRSSTFAKKDNTRTGECY
jgi:hypothetical protein